MNWLILIVAVFFEVVWAVALKMSIEKADSWDCDAHKTLNAGYDCGLVMCRHRKALTEALAANGVYIAYGENRDNMLYLDKAVQGSGECWCGGSVWEGHPVIRISVCSHATTKEDIDRSVDVFRKTMRSGDHVL